MNIYYVNYQSGYLLGNSPFFSDDAVYILNSKYSSTKCVYVKTEKNEFEFNKFLKNAVDKGYISRFIFAKENNDVFPGWFNSSEIESLKMLRMESKIEKISKKLNKKISNNSIGLIKLENEFENIVGLKEVKSDIKDLYTHIQISKERNKRGLSNDPVSLHAVLTGAPGTGKTTMARKIGKLYKELGILKKGHVVEVDRSGLVGKYQGHSESGTIEKLKESLDGILFIDEAYSLGETDKSDDFGHKVIDVLLKFMEDNRDRMAVFVAGYDDKMKNFLSTNPGLKSRFINHYQFKSYTSNEMLEIFDIIMKNKYSYSNEVKDLLKVYFEKIIEQNDPQYFGNGREVRNASEYIIKIQNRRIFNTEDYHNKNDNFFKEINNEDVKTLFKKNNLKINRNLFKKF